jgi:hypothetical protein
VGVRPLGPWQRNRRPCADRSHRIGYGLDSASEWQDVLKTALQAALVVAVLDALRLSRSSKWFEDHSARPTCSA